MNPIVLFVGQKLAEVLKDKVMPEILDRIGEAIKDLGSDPKFEADLKALSEQAPKVSSYEEANEYLKKLRDLKSRT